MRFCHSGENFRAKLAERGKEKCKIKLGLSCKVSLKNQQERSGWEGRNRRREFMVDGRMIPVRSRIHYQVKNIKWLEFFGKPQLFIKSF